MQDSHKQSVVTSFGMLLMQLKNFDDLFFGLRFFYQMLDHVLVGTHDELELEI